MAELEAGVHWHAKSVELHPTAEPADKMQVCLEESQLNFDKQRSMGRTAQLGIAAATVAQALCAAAAEAKPRTMIELKTFMIAIS
jgi:hypothetical protein